MVAVLVAVVALLLSLAAPFAVKPWLVRLGVVDVPTGRSSHSRPTIRGVGAAVAIALFVALVLAAWLAPSGALSLAVCAGACAAGAILGWAEDLRGVPVRIRAVLQLGIGLAATWILAEQAGPYFLWLLPAGTIAVAAYINVANFMDGINGISASHGLIVGVFYAVAGQLNGLPWLILAGLAIAAAFAGFLPWNLGRGSVFLGDVGSYLLGAAISVTAVAAFLAGIPVEYIFSPVLIYLADTFVTLLRRVLAGERWYAPHRQHAYQRLTIVGLSHLQATLVVSAATIATSLLGMLAARSTLAVSVPAGALAAVVVLVYLRSPTFVQRLRHRRAART